MVVRKAILISLEESWILFIDKLFPFESRIKKKNLWKLTRHVEKDIDQEVFFYHDMQLLNDWLRSKHEKTPRLGGTDKTTTPTKRTIAFNIGNNDKKKKTNTQTTYKYCTSRQPDLKFKDTKDKEIHFQWNQSNHELKQNKKQGRKEEKA